MHWLLERDANGFPISVLVVEEDAMSDENLERARAFVAMCLRGDYHAEALSLRLNEILNEAESRHAESTRVLLAVEWSHTVDCPECADNEVDHAGCPACHMPGHMGHVTHPKPCPLDAALKKAGIR